MNILNQLTELQQNLQSKLDEVNNKRINPNQPIKLVKKETKEKINAIQKYMKLHNQVLDLGNLLLNAIQSNNSAHIQYYTAKLCLVINEISRPEI